MARQGHKSVIAYKSEYGKLEKFSFISHAGKIFTVNFSFPVLISVLSFEGNTRKLNGQQGKEHHPVQAVCVAIHHQFEKD